MENHPIPSPAKAPETEGAGASASPQSPEQKEMSPREKMAQAITGFIAALRDYEPENERARISLRIVVEQMLDRFNGNMGRVAEHYALVPELESARAKFASASEADKLQRWRELAAAESMQSIYEFITDTQSSLVKKAGRREIDPLITAVDPAKARRKESPLVAEGLELNTKALEQHLDEYLKWLDARRGHAADRDAITHNGRNLFLDIIGGETHFNAPVSTVRTTIEDLRAQERGMKRDIARRDLRASIRRELERVNVKASNISIEISGNPLSNPDGTIDIVLDRIEIKDAELLERRSSVLPKGAVGGPELDALSQERIAMFIASSLNLLFVRSPRHTRWISFSPDFALRFTKGDDNTPVQSVPGKELGLELPMSYEEALDEIGSELKKVATDRSRTLTPYQQRGRWRVVMTDVENYGQPMEERFAPVRVEQLVFQLMRHNPEFKDDFINGKTRIIQLFGEDLAVNKDLPGYRSIVDMRTQGKGDPYGFTGPYTLPDEASDEQRSRGVVIVGPTGLVQRRKVTPVRDPKTGEMKFELMRSLGFADWERREEVLKNEIRELERVIAITGAEDRTAASARLAEKRSALKSHSEKLSLVRAFYEDLSDFRYPADPRIESLVRSFGVVVSQEGVLSDVSQIVQLLNKLSVEDRNAWTESNKYFNHYYSVYEEMGLAELRALDGGKGSQFELHINETEVARHAEEYLAWRESGYDKANAPKGGTNIFRLAQTHFGVKDKGLEQRAHALLEELEEKAEKRVALSPEEKKELEELSELQKQLEDFAFSTNMPEPDESGREETLARIRLFQHYLEQLRKAAVMIEEKQAGALDRVNLLKSFLEKFRG